jgi:succinate dehydrogenase hydrophobic anchor subunit
LGEEDRRHFLGLAGMLRRIPDYAVQFTDWDGVSPIADPPSVVRWIRGGMHALLLIALVLAAAQHSYLGTRVIVADYVGGFKARVATLVTLQFMHIILAGAGVLSVLRVALGA